ncbi:hypothetical protein LV457_09525 [Mycobacterium sp. MYCO198283]|uniref:hypothetical protein n=1 Tax=Mycobacterium sp. MYCO198283 TaxID=2883505 RepID=UPI001E59F7FB|nr:hypothetical protein [Mycobacterium sp. MYCO198283]MCG5432530.1 hypothetical protein [Mycobacterium sp. MYCO198283]
MSGTEAARWLTRNRLAGLLGVVAVACVIGADRALRISGANNDAWDAEMLRRKCHPPWPPVPDNHAVGWFAVVLSAIFIICAWAALGVAAWKRRWWVIVLALVLAAVLTVVGLFFLGFGALEASQPRDAHFPADSSGVPCRSAW